MIEHEFPYESFIGGWYIPESICDDLIKLFLSAREKGHTVLGLQKSFNKVQVDKTRKDSEELCIKWNSTNDLIITYRVELQKVLENYAKKYDAVNYQAGFNVNTNYIIIIYRDELQTD